MGKIWTCKIGELENSLPDGADLPMREAVVRAYEELTGSKFDFIFSGWDGKLEEGEQKIVDLKRSVDKKVEDHNKEQSEQSSQER